jgi:hypothetical protein
MVNPLFAPIWQCNALLKFKIYAWNVVCGRCWTGERRRHHGLTTDDTCPLCLQDCERTDHLLLWCPYSCTIWFEVLKGLGEPGLPPLRIGLSPAVVALCFGPSGLREMREFSRIRPSLKLCCLMALSRRSRGGN